MRKEKEVIRGRLLVLALLFLLSLATVRATVTITLATNGQNISADTMNGTYTNLTGPTLSENASAEIGTGTIILTAPSGFAFDTNASVTVLVLRTSGGGPSSKNINNASNGTALAVTSITSAAITFTVTDASEAVGPGPAVTNSLTWQDVRVRPTAGTPLATGNITKNGTSLVSGVSNGTGLGTLTEVAGDLASIDIAPANATINQSQTQAYTADGFDAFSNSKGNVTSATTFNISAGAGGSFSGNVYTSSVGGTWTVNGSVGTVSDTATLTVIDITPPTLTLLGSNPYAMQDGGKYQEAGATAYDSGDGDRTAWIIIPPLPGYLSPGTYYLLYSVNDSAGNTAQANRTIIVESDDHYGLGPDAFSYFNSPSSTPQGEAARTEAPSTVAASAPSSPSVSAPTASAAPASSVSSGTEASTTAATAAEEAASLATAARAAAHAPLTGAVTGKGRMVDWSWIAGLGVLVLALLSAARAYRKHRPNDPESSRRTFLRSWKL